MNLRQAQEVWNTPSVPSLQVTASWSRFLFSLGCYSGEPITVIAQKKSGCVIAVKDGRYSIDKQLAEAIEI